jgi:hypothetical protein
LTLVDSDYQGELNSKMLGTSCSAIKGEPDGMVMASERRKQRLWLTGAYMYAFGSRTGPRMQDVSPCTGNCGCVVVCLCSMRRAVVGVQPLRRALANAYRYRWEKPPQHASTGTGGQSGFPPRRKRGRQAVKAVKGVSGLWHVIAPA